MYEWQQAQKLLRRKRLARALFAWALLLTAGFFLAFGVWAFLVIVIGALS